MPQTGRENAKSIDDRFFEMGSGLTMHSLQAAVCFSGVSFYI